LPAVHVLVVAKAPVAGHSKTRLCPPCTAQEAADIAEAALADTLDAVAACGASRRVVALDGQPGPWLPTGFDVIPQVPGSLAERLAAAWMSVGGPGLQIGMDTPQITPELLDACLTTLDSPHVDAVLGPACDGGWWSIGMHVPSLRVFADIPTSQRDTGARQWRRLQELELKAELLPRLRDIDNIHDALAVAAGIAGSRTAVLVDRLAVGQLPVRGTR
jgi:glycosyltransferase A (GT-A) superfamily protein (DUF2064 family)